jgi:hypothetical protein
MVAALSETSPEHHAFYALRICPKATADAWWSAVRSRHDVPPAITALMHGRTRVELTRAEAGAAIAWAGRLDGWADAQPKPLHVHPHA